MKRALFFVGNRPFSVWDPNIREKNLEFLKALDGNHFEYLADIHSTQLDGKNSDEAATALRAAYGLGIETLFSLLAAAVQAPDCVFGWLFQYRAAGLDLVVEAFRGRQPVRARFKGPLNWQSLSDAVHRCLVLPEKDKEARIKAGFASLWAGLAVDFLDRDLRTEYNSVKHGLRIQPGGFRLAIGRQDDANTPAPPERMQGLGGSTFGSTLLALEQIGSCKLDYRVRRISKNWDPPALAGRLRLISMSIKNTASCLRILSGEDPTTRKFVWPENLEVFDLVWRPIGGVRAFSIGARLAEDEIRPTTHAEVEASYNAEEAQAGRDA